MHGVDETGMFSPRIMLEDGGKRSPWPESTADLVEDGEGNPRLLFMKDWRRLGQRFLEKRELSAEIWIRAILSGESQKTVEKSMDEFGGTIMNVIDMPMNVV